MSQKAYIHVRTDLADAAAVATFVTANPTHYHIGSQIVAADGTVSIVSAAGVVGVIALVV